MAATFLCVVYLESTSAYPEQPVTNANNNPKQVVTTVEEGIYNKVPNNSIVVPPTGHIRTKRCSRTVRHNQTSILCKKCPFN